MMQFIHQVSFSLTENCNWQDLNLKSWCLTRAWCIVLDWWNCLSYWRQSYATCLDPIRPRGWNLIPHKWERTHSVPPYRRLLPGHQSWESVQGSTLWDFQNAGDLDSHLQELTDSLGAKDSKSGLALGYVSYHGEGDAVQSFEIQDQLCHTRWNSPHDLLRLQRHLEITQYSWIQEKTDCAR